ncbi:UDP-N-acetylglucosamine 1-carboxyvinyltransferase [Candidatus Cardinium hertigii]|jgi:UDP-N-acetylglucosamine 1-carboxyvinyltransferase|uniref:UDP-N-acetylglucosamine 1-carboxyvinyltransferase n=1 Tax=Candidatus Cardinium hertigii TaxID=247481 RepID=A0A3N2QDU0_9BACT|nr:UDP-N-acetylglucosamine 1-carboxyvinyltransferase [Candidatus Cardinium hertigii]ROT46964.1 UDP-N-acetylglucosamine 1-carboxyvinyltransferase [Candidatus Cardinium hertigii]ROT47829.1 UDP-N-acetylglucosamine 1-carboxyvinyltransferase [Candidatus Cardinium hertigii]
MHKFIVHGGRPLSGTIKPKGSKNEALQVMCATLLTEAIVTINNIPDITDVHSVMQLLTLLGVQIVPLGKGSYQFCAAHLHTDVTLTEIFRQEYAKVRGSIMLLAPLLVRFKSVSVPKPGGDRIGRRGVHAHFEGLERLGVTFCYNVDEEAWKAKCTTLSGSYILMPEPSVTGTANIVMAASMAKGKTIIYPAACEPHVQQLCHMLVAMGATITGIGSNILTIEGVAHLSGTVHTILPDMLEIGSFIGLAAATKSTLTITDVPINLFTPVWSCFRKLGIRLEEDDNSLHIPFQPSYHIQKEIDGNLLSLSDAVWPGIPADLISIAIITAVHAHGHILIHQKMFESRLFFVDHLIEMGARLILCDPHRVHVVGLGNAYRLRGTRMSSNDIRAGITLLIAALAAEGTSTIANIHQIDRGYEQIDQRLNALGASIERA